MNAFVRYLAGGALALSSQGFFAVSFGLPSVTNPGADSLQMMRVQDVQPADAKALIKSAALQEVDRSRKGDRLQNLNAAPDPLLAGNEIVSNDVGARKLIKPVVVKPAKREVEPKLPEGCNAAVSPLSDRIAAAQASNCITALELPFKVASAQ